MILSLLSFLLLFNCALTADNCPTNSQDDTCASFVLPAQNASELSLAICSNNPYLSTCSLFYGCKSGATSTRYCSDAFALYATICNDVDDVERCDAYMKMCGSSPASSKVQQCKNSPSIPSFPMTSEVIKNVYGICTSMPTMRACDSCKLSGDSVNTGNVNGCDVMKTYSSLCIDMPDMSQCTSYKSMCSQNPTMSWCETPPQASGMAMYFHTSMGNYILFQSWFPSTTGQYALAWLATFCLALVYEIIVVAIEVWEIHLRYKYNARKAQQQNSSMQKSRPILSHFGGYTNESLGQGAAGLRGMFRFVQASVGYLCMLIVMTYNVGLFFAIMMGFAIGTWLFRPIGIGYAEKLKVFTLQPEDACMC